MTARPKSAAATPGTPPRGGARRGWPAASALALALCAATSPARAADADDPWGSGPEAPSPTAPLPYPQAPREPGANKEVLAVPPRAPDPARPPLPLPAGLVDAGVSEPLGYDARLESARTRKQLFAHGALDPDTALVDVAGVWLRHEQAGDSRFLLRGLDDRDLDVVLDGVPLFDLGGLVPPLEQLSNAGAARLVLHHGARALTASPRGAAGVLEVDSLAGMVDEGEQLGLHGTIGGGYGGADLEKGVFTFASTGYGRARLGVHATLLDREDERLGRGDVRVGEEPGGVLPRSFGDGGAVGARVDVAPLRATHLFSTWQSARSITTPHPDLCGASDDRGRALDCVVTDERGLDAWIVGGDQAVDVGGASLVARGRAHAQHAISNESRAGTGITVVERALDEGVRAGARAALELTLPPVALLDVLTPRASVSGDVYADRVTSHFFSRSVLRRDAEPPGDGLEDPSRARLNDGAVDGFSALSLSLAADGARTSVWAAGRVSAVDVTGEAGARVRVVDGLEAYAAVVHLAHDDSVEGGLAWRSAWLDVDAGLYGAARSAAPPGALAGPGAVALVAGPSLESASGDTVAWGAEARALLKPGLDGLTARTTLAVVTVDDGGLLDATRAARAGVPNPGGTLEVDYEPHVVDGVGVGFFSRARFLLPQQRLSSAEELDRALCPQLPSVDDLAAGAVQTTPCSGAPGAFLFDVGAHLDFGGVRFDAVGENLLDQQGALRDEPIGFGGAAFRGMVTLAL